jgi:hypothetical protein
MALIGKKIAGAVAPVGAVALYKGTKHSNDEDEATKEEAKESGKQSGHGHPSGSSVSGKGEISGQSLSGWDGSDRQRVLI